MKRNWLLILVLGFIVLFSLTLFFLFRQSTVPSVSTASLHFNNTMFRNEEVKAMEGVLQRFRSLYPEIQLNFSSNESQPSDILILSNPLDLNKSWMDTPTPWTGDLWVLAANREHLKSLDTEAQAAVKPLREGKGTPEDFILLLEALKRKGYTPLTLGNSHGWPFIVWLQHWTAARFGPEKARTIPNNGESPELDLAFQELATWKEKGWFALEPWNEGWARGLRWLNDGKASLALVSAQHWGPIEASNRSKFEYLAFPRNPDQNLWSVGSVSFLAINPQTRHPEAARLLVRFLSSPGITSELSQATNRPYFSWDSQTKMSPDILPSWADAALSPSYESLKERYRP